MATANLTIQVSEEAARAFAQATPEDQQKIQLLLDLRLRDLTLSPPPRRSLQAVMDEIGNSAAARGLTPAGLESLPVRRGRPGAASSERERKCDEQV